MTVREIDQGQQMSKNIYRYILPPSLTRTSHTAVSRGPKKHLLRGQIAPLNHGRRRPQAVQSTFPMMAYMWLTDEGTTTNVHDTMITGLVSRRVSDDPSSSDIYTAERHAIGIALYTTTNCSRWIHLWFRSSLFVRRHNTLKNILGIYVCHLIPVWHRNPTMSCSIFGHNVHVSTTFNNRLQYLIFGE